MGLTDPWTCYCIDEIVWTFGLHVDGVVHEAIENTRDQKTKNTKAQQAATAALNHVLRQEVSDEPPKGTYADPMATAKVRKRSD